MIQYLLQEDHEEEFDKLEAIGNHIESMETTFVAKSGMNLKRNRYKNIVPYDTNIVYLDSAVGNPPSKYINASKVTLQ